MVKEDCILLKNICGVSAPIVVTHLLYGSILSWLSGNTAARIYLNNVDFKIEAKSELLLLSYLECPNLGDQPALVDPSALREAAADLWCPSAMYMVSTLAKATWRANISSADCTTQILLLPQGSDVVSAGAVEFTILVTTSLMISLLRYIIMTGSTFFIYMQTYVPIRPIGCNKIYSYLIEEYITCIYIFLISDCKLMFFNESTLIIFN
jgi:hypothetical protein